jgi:hypothetical protein
VSGFLLFYLSLRILGTFFCHNLVTTDKMDDIFKAESPFQLIDPMTVEEIKVPKCADQFIRLLDGIKERYCCLPQPGHQCVRDFQQEIWHF